MITFEYTLVDLVVNLLTQIRPESTIKVTQPSTEDENSDRNTESRKMKSEGFDATLREAWDLAQANGLFRYGHKTNIPTKILPGKFNYIAQLNPDRAQKRRKPQEIKSANQAFNPDAFNFTKAKSCEMIMSLKSKFTGIPKTANHASEEINMIFINVSPLEYGHVLIVPNLYGNEPQLISLMGLRVALQVLLLNKSCDFRVGFNSLCGYASVNHHHYHGYYLNHRLFIEHAELKVLAGPCHVLVDEEYPAQAFIFVLDDVDSIMSKMEDFLQNSFSLILHLQQSNTAHNFFMTRASTKNEVGHFDSVRLYIWARRSSYGVKESGGFNPALCELAGHFPIKTESIFEFITEDQICEVLKTICQEEFNVTCRSVVSLFQ